MWIKRRVEMEVGLANFDFQGQERREIERFLSVAFDFDSELYGLRSQCMRAYVCIRIAFLLLALAFLTCI